MHQHDPRAWGHTHNYATDTASAERRTHIVIGITATMMFIEIAGGMAFNSMALLADGWHMSTHVAAFLITALAYHFARRHGNDPRYSFGAGKMGVLGGFTSAIILVVVALLMAVESVQRMFNPLPIQFGAAIAVAAAGLMVNVVCALLLKEHHHHHGHAHSHAHHHDLNRHAAYLHVLADALTSVTAIIALLAGKFFGWSWMDPAMGIVGSLVITVWAIGLIRATSGILLDRTPESCDLPEEIRRAVERDGDAVLTDLHVWQVASGRFAAIVSLVAEHPLPVDEYRERLREHEELVHVTIETQQCQTHEPGPAGMTSAARQ